MAAKQCGVRYSWIPTTKVSQQCGQVAPTGDRCILHSEESDKNGYAFNTALWSEIQNIGATWVSDVRFPRDWHLFDFMREAHKRHADEVMRFAQCYFEGPVVLIFRLCPTGRVLAFDSCTFRGEVYITGGYVKSSLTEIRFDNSWFEKQVAIGAHVEIPSLLSAVSAVFMGDVRLSLITDYMTLRNARVDERLGIRDSTIGTLDISSITAADWRKVSFTGITHPDGVRIKAANSPLAESTFVDVIWPKQDGRLLLADEADIESKLISSATVVAAYRSLIDVFERTRQVDLAEECFVAAMDLQRHDQTLPRTHRWAIALYDIASRYGSSYMRACKFLATMLLLFAVLYSIPGFGLRRTDPRNQMWSYSRRDAAIRRIGGAILHTLEVTVFIKNPLYETNRPAGKIVEVIEVIVIPAQVAILLFAIRRRFKR